MEKPEKQEDKRAQIIEAAIRRFAHFGIDKTSMSEVAEDLSISKANLYYYFPEKWTLIEAIVESIFAESDREIEQILKQEFAQGTEHLLNRISDVKMAYFSKYKLLVQDLGESQARDQRFRALAERMAEKDRSMVAKVLEIGENTGELVAIDIHATSDLYTVLMRGLALYCKLTSPPQFFDLGAAQVVQDRQRAFVKIFVNGIKRK